MALPKCKSACIKGCSTFQASLQFSQVPKVDLSLDELEASQKLYDACETVGFFYVVNHGIPLSLIDGYFSTVKDLFALPLEEKMKILQDENNRGYTPYGEETLDPENQSEGDMKEGYYFGREVDKNSSEAQLPLHGPNQWPSESVLPGFRNATETFIVELKALGNRLLVLLALGLKLPRNFFLDKYEDPLETLRLLRYAPEVSNPGQGKFGAGAHSDYGVFTILANDDVPGLQIFTNGEWTDVNPIPGAFIINIGDCLERWTNGYFKSTLHRVINVDGRERFSIPFFYDPNFNTLIECLPQCHGSDGPKYPPVLYGQHLLDKFSETHAGYTGPTTA